MGTAASPGATVLPLVAELLEALERAGVSYCHWKSNEAIERSASGANDLDLLIARDGAAVFARTLHDLGFLVARPRANRQLPGIIDYYGRDRDTGRILHVHAHHQLVLGDDMTKNFRLPIEGAYLASATSDGLFMLPSAEFEYVVFVLRMVVKHAPWDAQLGRKGRLTPSERRELAYLQERIDRAVVAEIIRVHLPFLDRRTFAVAERALEEDAGRAIRAFAGRRVLRALRAHGRRPGAADLGLRVLRREWGNLLSRLPVRHTGKRLDTGGMVIAIVGGDGAGKSSAVDVVAALLSHDFETHRFHMGKPPWSRVTTAVRRPMRKLRQHGLFSATTAPPWEVHTSYPGLAFLLWHVLTARDRLLEYQRIRRVVGSGGIAVCDRFPLPDVRMMDAPRLRTVEGLERRPWARWLAEAEARCYAHLLPPDLLIVLRVPPDEAVRRRPEQDAEFVRRRAQEVYDTDWSATDAVVIDAGRTKAEVEHAVAAAVWSTLQGRVTAGEQEPGRTLPV
jgi:thymidylate kinase